MLSVFWPFRGIKGNKKVILTTDSPMAIVDGYINQAKDNLLVNLYGLILANTGGTQNTVDITDGTVNISVDVPANDTKIITLARDDAIELTAGNTEWVGRLRAGGSIEVTALFVRN